MRAMILAAGRGKRMMPLTKNTPKPLLKVKGVSLIEHSIYALKSNAIVDIVINTAYQSKALKDYLGNGAKWGVNIEYSIEANGALETAGGIIKALPLLGSKPFIVLNSDILFDYDLSNLQLPKNRLAHLILVDNPTDHPNGDFSLTKTQQITLITDKSYTFAGIGIYHPDLFSPYQNKTKKLPLSQVFKDAIGKNQLSGEYFAGRWQDIGTPDSLVLANQNF